MKGLIPLKLQASVTVPKPGCSEEIQTPAPSVAPPKFELQIFPEAPMRPDNLPYTQQQWRDLLDEVKAMYWKQKYEECFTRCQEALDHVRGPVHPLHLIYLSFYAATCLETKADPLKDGSLEKSSVLKLAKTYYRRADSFMTQALAEESPEQVDIVEQPQSSLRPSISVSSVRSPSVASSTGANSASNFSADNFSSPAPSPTSSISSFSSLSEQTPKLQPPRFTKRAQFQPTLPTVLSVGSINEHAIPHSPEKPFTSSLEVIKEGSQNDSIVSKPQSEARRIYNTHLTSLRLRIKQHIVGVNSRLIDSQMQRLRDTSKELPPAAGFERFDSMSSLQVEVGITDDDRRVTSAIRQARIDELKARGEEHKKKGYYDGSRSQKLAETTLTELREFVARGH